MIKHVAKRHLTVKEGNALAGELYQRSWYDPTKDILLQGATSAAYTEEGQPLMVLVHQAIPEDMCRLALKALRSAATPTDNRGMAAGNSAAKRLGANLTSDSELYFVRSKDGKRQKRIKADGTVEGTTRAPMVRSGVAGAIERMGGRFPYCRQTAWTLQHAKQFKAAEPYIRAVSDVFKEYLPDRWQAQYERVKQTDEHWIINGTAFSTVSVNKNFQTAVHKDAGDLHEGFGVMAVLSSGEYEGGYTILPEYRCGADVRMGDVILFDVHSWHCNTPIHGRGRDWERISCVFYYRERLYTCGTPAEEFKRARAATAPPPPPA